MEIREFAIKIQRAMTEVLGDGYEVKLQEVRKNNGILLQGLIVMSKEKNISPTIYLKPFWEAYNGGVPLAEIVCRMLQIYREDTPKDSIDMSFFKDFDKVKDRICYRLINAAQNRKLLEKIPYVPFLDLAICFYYAYEGEILGNGTILIYNSHVDMWKTSTAELMRCAVRNTPRLFEGECNSMEFVVRELLRERENQCGKILLDEAEQQSFLADMPMQIVSNRQRVNGAAVILYPGFLEKLGDKFESDFYILPSSVHEVILLLDDGHENPRRLKSMIAEVNSTQVEPEEVLSDSLYYFDREEKIIRIIG